MSNDRERLAREWAKDCQGEGKLPAYGIAAQAAAEHIMATTKEPTMADVEWNSAKYVLTGATLDTKDGPVEVVMLAGAVDGIDYATLGGEFGWDSRYEFTPNGKRYKLVEVTGDEHPETLTTVKDYENAPVGTIAARNRFYPMVKHVPGVWLNPHGDERSDVELDFDSRQVLRWGWGE